jgi:hypothetical protein
MPEASSSLAALRRLPRPCAVLACSECHAPRATRYPHCRECYHALEDFWLADWQPVLTREQIISGSADETLLADSQAQRLMAYIKAGQIETLAAEFHTIDRTINRFSSHTDGS